MRAHGVRAHAARIFRQAGGNGTGLNFEPGPESERALPNRALELCRRKSDGNEGESFRALRV